MATPAILVNIDVDDLDRAVAFYTRLLGVKVGRRFGEMGIELIGSSAPIYLLAKVAGTPASPSSADRRRYERHWTPVHLDFAVPDLERPGAGCRYRAGGGCHPGGAHRNPALGQDRPLGRSLRARLLSHRVHGSRLRRGGDPRERALIDCERGAPPPPVPHRNPPSRFLLSLQGPILRRRALERGSLVEAR